MAAASAVDYKTPRSWLVLSAFLVVVIGVGALIGTQTSPGTWYQNLEKPPFNPPNWVFGPVWFTLYAMIAVAGWRIFMIDASSTAMKLWFAQMVVNWTWSPVFFIGEMLWLALAVILIMIALIIGFIVSAGKLDKLAAWLFVPYAAWVGFATLLNASLAILN
ncbi:TspO/MBR family protein [Devosia sp. RR2S18]|uniref:TspO/MBR family protein n=1 Tax=Devosia rhizosphaerae TaxID=3049774 RepID=UPI0025412D6E|nr:TspO/MBR family protein [Devosia sp. RR2S18]WIJ24204.1 TspO/MBR family protein [Devosia sp. RR2S18]